MSLVDVHSHLAWGVDDGFQTREQTITGLEILSKQNVTCIIATPHFLPDITEEKMNQINSRIEELQSLAKEYSIQIIKGGEFYLGSNYLDLLDKGLINSIGNTNYVLAEFNVTRPLGNNREVEERLYELSARDYQVIIAHVERYFSEKIDLKRVQSWVNEGYLIQVNSTSLLGIHGTKIQKNAIALLDAGLVHFVGTDMHQPHGKRDPNLPKAYHWLESHYSKEKADILCKKNGIHIILDEEVEEIEPVRKSLFKKIFHF